MRAELICVTATALIGGTEGYCWAARVPRSASTNSTPGARLSCNKFRRTIVDWDGCGAE